MQGDGAAPAAEKQTWKQMFIVRGIVLGSLLLVMWALVVVDVVLPSDKELINYGIVPRTGSGLLGILWAPFLHVGIGHIAANTIPFLVLGFLVSANAKSMRLFWVVFAWVSVVGGLGTWLIGRANTVHVGASGAIFGFFGFLLMFGWFDRSPRRWIRLGLALVVGVIYGTLIFSIFGGEGVSWEGHLCGLLAGVAGAAVLGWYQRRKEKRAQGYAVAGDGAGEDEHEHEHDPFRSSQRAGGDGDVEMQTLPAHRAPSPPPPVTNANAAEDNPWAPGRQPPQHAQYPSI